MFYIRKTTPQEPNNLEKAIARNLAEMDQYGCNSPEYAKMVEQLAKLYKLKEFDNHGRVSADTKAIILGNLVSIALILGYERANVLTSKALGFVMRLR